MVTNPNSNLVFDFPDPTPRFEFDDSPTRNNNNKPNNNNNTPPSRKTGKRFGKFSTKKLITGRGGNSSGGGSGVGEKDDGLDETNDTAATSLNSSLNSSSTATNSNSPPSLKRNNSGDKAAGLNFTLADSSSSNINNNNSSSSSSTKLNLLPSIGSTTLHKRNPSIASGYVSEVSEFSFDRVTVTTNDTDGIMTGQSSNVSWNFMDETVLGAGGLQLQSGGGGGVEGTTKYNNSTRSVGCVPYTGGGGSLLNGTDGKNSSGRNGSPDDSRLMDTPTRETGVALTMNMASSQAALTNNNNSQQQTKKRGGGGGRGRTQSSSTFDNVSLDTEDELDNIPFNGMVQRSDNSVISEISERSRRTATQSQVGEGAVKALLREGMVNVNLRENGMLLDPALSNESESTLRRRSSHHNQQQQLNINNKNDGAKSTTSSKTSNYNNLLEDITSNYTKFKTSRNNGQKEGRSILSSIIEDVQFCGLYFCGIDTTVTEDDEEAAMMQKNNKGGGVSSYEETLKKKKEGRKKETEDTFLGKVISCVPKTMCGVDYEEHTTTFCGGGR